LKYKANKNKKGNNDETVLHICVIMEKNDILKLLLEFKELKLNK